MWTISVFVLKKKKKPKTFKFSDSQKFIKIHNKHLFKYWKYLHFYKNWFTQQSIKFLVLIDWLTRNCFNPQWSEEELNSSHHERNSHFYIIRKTTTRQWRCHQCLHQWHLVVTSTTIMILLLLLLLVTVIIAALRTKIGTNENEKWKKHQLSQVTRVMWS